MSGALTCWKEIANYLGKGVRTVQRWEREDGLPVKRPSSRQHGVVFAWPDELDAWTKRQPLTQDHESPENELFRLRTEVECLRAENEVLRHELRALADRAAQESNFTDGNSTEAILYRCALLLAANKAQRRACAELTSMSLILRNRLELHAPPGIQ